MPRCAKIVRGKRCKAYCIAGSKYCLFHTPGQRMKRGKKKKTDSSRAEFEEKSTLQTSVENQIVMRGSRFLGAAIAAHAIRYMNAPDYQVIRTKKSARINRQGTVYVGAHTQRTIEPTRSDWGRGFKQTDNPSRKRKSATTRYRAGKVIPYLGIGFMAYNLGANWGSQEKDPVIKANPEGFWLYDIASATEWTVKQTMKAGIVNVLTGGMFTAGDLVSD